MTMPMCLCLTCVCFCATRTVWTTKPKISTTCPFTENVWQLLLSINHSNPISSPCSPYKNPD